GVVVQNVGTAIAVKEAISDGKALIERIVTVSGNAFSNPGNYRVKLGTPVSVLLEAAGYMPRSKNYLFMGGPMMGKAITDTSVPIVKATSGLVAIEKHRMKDAVEYPCIQCAACVSACPMFLLPTQIISFAKAKDWHKSEELGVLSCMECGSCVYACPSNIPLVQWIKIAKYKVIEQKRKQVS
ncbi:MAG: SLBB domain-containing protein, partial [Candidatus Marinimicrobia bacterium]|nr:SLBB domain-containing protein [Candidatus Neomarinimicrobiota bacterium]